MTNVSGTNTIENQLLNQYDPSTAVLTSGFLATAWTDTNNAMEDGNWDTDPIQHIAIQVDAIQRLFVGDATVEIFRGDALEDRFLGSTGSDTFIYARGGRADTILDLGFSGTDDTIRISGFADVHTFTELMSKGSQVGANAVFNFGNGDTLTLNNVTRSSLTAADFSFLTFDDHVELGLASFGAAAGGWANNRQYLRLMGDVTGDGKADIVGFGADYTYVARSNGSTFANPYVGIASFGSSAAGGGWADDDTYHRVLGDVNGDGRADIIGFGADYTYVALSNGATFANPIIGIASFGSSAAGGGWTSDDSYHREVADVNGDGRADIVGFGYAGTYVALGQANGTFANPSLAIASFGAGAGGWSSQDSYYREMADVNGDGRADIVGFGADLVYVALGQSNGTFANPIAALASFGSSAAGGGWATQDQYTRHLGDVNSDGYADIVGFGYSGTYIAYGKADGTFDAPHADLASFSAGPAAGGWSSNNLYPRMLADIDGGGSADIVGFGGAGAYLSHSNVD